MHKILLTMCFCLATFCGYAQTEAFAILKFYSKKERPKCTTEIKVGNQFPFSIKPGEIGIFKLNSLDKIIISFNQCGPVSQKGVVFDVKLNCEAGKTYYFYIINGVLKPDWVVQIDETEFNKFAKKASTTLDFEEE